MKTNRMIWNIGRYMCLALLVAFASCIRDEFVENGTVSYEKGLCFSLYADGDMQLAGTRSAGVDALNENRISTVDIFLFKNDGSLNEGGYAHADVTTSDEVVYLYKGSDWLNNFSEQAGPYTVYALANYKGDAQLRNVLSLDDLKAVVAKDEDVVKWEGMGGYTGKTFLMDGKKTVTYAELQSAQGSGQPYVANVPVSRAAVKIELTLNFSEDWATKFMATGLEAQLSNYASITPALADGNPLDGDQRGLSNYPGKPEEAVENFSSDPVFYRPTGTYSGSKIRFYTYVNRWDDFINNETMLLIDLPGRYDEKGNPETDNPDAEVLNHNFYKVPIINNAKPQVFQRNTFYQITATVDMKGTETVDVPVELTDVQFKTAPWVEKDINVGEGDTPSYLVLSESHVDIRNADGYNELEFYSSSPITSVTIVGFRSQDEATAAGVDFIYPGDGTTIPGAFFVNKDNERTSVSLGNPTFTQNATNGTISLVSPNPTNVTKRYITLKVTNDDGISKYVVVEQYPLEYIQPIAGYYSYRDDLDGGTYEEKGNTYGINSSTIYESSWWGTSYIFVSKVYYNNQIYGWYWANRNTNSPTRVSAGSYNYSSFPNNNMMYFVTITQTSDDYKLAHPLTENVNDYGGQLATVSSSGNDQLVSPSFMLASQLGTVLASGFDWNKAREHCSYYVETYRKDNKTYVLDDWRLPTSEEIAIISKYQDETPDVMAVVLSGSYYYVGWSEAQGVNDWGQTVGPKGTAYTGKSGGDAAVRCIRDVKPTDAFLQSNN